MRKKYNTPHRRHVVKTRMTDEEYADFTGRLAAYEISQSEFIRQAIRKATIRPIVTVSPVNDGLLAALSKLTAEYGKIGGNLNQIARSLNEYGSPYRGLEKEVRGAAADLAALKFEVLQKVGEAVGDSWFYGLGFWTRANAEVCLLATRGHPKRQAANIHQFIISPIEAHSKKPDEARDKIVALMGDLPRVELFARQTPPQGGHERRLTYALCECPQ